jgi:hypothetical protein
VNFVTVGKTGQNDLQQIPRAAGGRRGRTADRHGSTPHDGLDLAARTWKRHRAEIRALFGYREATVADAEVLEDWLRDQAATVGTVPDHLVARLKARRGELP